MSGSALEGERLRLGGRPCCPPAHPDVDRDAGQQQQEALENDLVAGTGDRPQRVAEGQQRDHRVGGQPPPGEAGPVADQQHELRRGRVGVGDEGGQGRQQDDEGELVDQALGVAHGHEQGHQDAGDDQAEHWRAAAAGPREHGREQPVAGGRHRDLALQQDPAVEGAERRDDGADRDRVARPAAEHLPGGVRERGVGAGQGGGGDDPHDRDRAEDVDQRGEQGAEDGRAWDGALGVLDVPGRDGRRLQADERPQGQGRGGRDRAEGRPAAGVERAEVAALDEQQPHRGDRQQRPIMLPTTRAVAIHSPNPRRRRCRACADIGAPFTRRIPVSMLL